MEKQNIAKPEQEKKRKKKIIFFIIILLLIIAGFIILKYLKKPQNDSTDNSPPLFDTSIDGNVEEGGLVTKSDAEIQEELKRKLEESMMTISMNLSPVFYDGKSEGNLNIVNEEENNFMQVIEIYRKDTNQLIYKSGGIPVGSKIEKAKLDVNLEQGVYDCLAYFNAVNAETGEFIGKAGAELKITIEN